MYVTLPGLRRESIRALDMTSIVKGEQADYELGRFSVMVPLFKATSVEDARKTVVRAKAGDELVLMPKVVATVRHRIVTVEPHGTLFNNGRVSARRIYVHGDTITGAVRWMCDRDTNLDELPFLYEIYISEQHIR